MSVEFQSELKLLEAVERLGKIEVMPRRYFRPSLDETNGIGKGRKSREISKKYLCIPNHFGIKESEVIKIADAIKD